MMKQFLTIAIAILAFPWAALGQNASSYSYRQVNTDEAVFAKTVGPVPTDLIVTETIPNSTIAFDVRSLQIDFLSLATRAKIDIRANTTGATSFQTVEAHAKSTASLIDEAIIEGVDGISGGTISFAWLVTGNHQLVLDATGGNLIGVDQMSVSANLTTTIPNAVSQPLNSTLSFPGTRIFNQVSNQQLPVSTGLLEFEVPWQTNGETIAIGFDLTTQADFHGTNLDAGEFEALLMADFYNTAKLNKVEIMDSQGMLLSNATLISRNSGTVYVGAVPEPSSILIWASCLGIAIARRRQLREGVERG